MPGNFTTNKSVSSVERISLDKIFKHLQKKTPQEFDLKMQQKIWEDIKIQ